jgi:predicted metalloenzyme YecM
MNSIKKILKDPTPFLDNLFKDLKNTQIDVDNFELDHICYRVETLERYNELKNLMLEISILTF